MAGGAEDLPVTAQRHVVRRILGGVGESLSDVRRFHRVAGRSAIVAGFAKQCGAAFGGDGPPDASLFPRTMDRVAVEARAPRYKTRQLCPLLCSGVMDGILYSLLVLVACDAEIFDGLAKQRGRTRATVGIVANSTANLTVCARLGRGIGR